MHTLLMTSVYFGAFIGAAMIPVNLYSLEKLKLNRIEVYTFLSTKDVTLVGVK